ncbi:MAG: C10 family peptidase [Candidatus Delongbacteria bacterium]|nr:C10 family peptidase [Candidatus Delongbacteria bacterium]MBN2834168.1 C10 family peptidase [Candidatus Delongbacteria bacterium]
MYKYILLVMMIVSAAYSAAVDGNQTRKVAENWYSHFFGNNTIDQTYELGRDGETQLMAYTFINGGFVLVATDDASIPVIGFSKDSKFRSDINNMPSMDYWFNGFYTQMEEIKSAKADNSETRETWDKVLNNDFSFVDSKAKSVEPLIETTWDQNPLYNNYCPEIGGQLAVVGCVATAMAQIVNYHNYPDFGYGTKTYYCSQASQSLTAVYKDTNYKWDLMPNQINGQSTEEEIHEVAQLSYHLGVSVEMMYGTAATGGSGAFSEDVPAALRNYFKYDNSCVLRSKQSYTSANWNALLQNELDNARPVYYAGSGAEGGHAFVMDGYQATNHYHFNWGWSGANDGYFYLSSLNPGSGGAGGGGYNFTQNQRAIVNIFPKPVNLSVNSVDPEILLEDTPMTYNLNELFTSAQGSAMTFTIEELQNEGVVNAQISGNTLTFTRIGEGIAQIRVRATATGDTCFEIFNILGRESRSFAGNGYMTDLGENGYVEYLGQAHYNLEKMTIHGQIYFEEGSQGGLFSMSPSTTSGVYVTINSTGIMKFMVETQDNQKRKAYSETELVSGTWYTLDFVYDGKDQYIFIDGNLDVKKEYATESLMKPLSNTFRAGYVAGSTLVGCIDNVYVYDRPIWQEEIINLLHNEISDDYIIGMDFNDGYGKTFINTFDGAEIKLRNLENDCYTPSLAPIIYFITEQTQVSGTLPGEENSQFSVVQNPTIGTLNLNTDGSFTYNPNSGISMDFFVFHANSNGVLSANYSVWIKLGTVGINDNMIPESSEIVSAYPNPFNPTTNISFMINTNDNIKLAVYNSNGALVQELFSGKLTTGLHSISFDASKLSSGIYFCRMVAGSEMSNIKLMLIK